MTPSSISRGARTCACSVHTLVNASLVVQTRRRDESRHIVQIAAKYERTVAFVSDSQRGNSAPEACSHERGTILSGASLAAETGGCAGEEGRLKAGCSQDWLPHKTGRFANRPQVCQLAPQSTRVSGECERCTHKC